MKNNFWKIQASGNDFILVDKNKFELSEDLSFFVTKICTRKTGIGADGFIILDKISSKDLKWDFYNSDGSSAEMCGNASRAVAKFFVEVWGGDKKSTLQTLGGTTELEYVSGNKLKVAMPKRDFIAKENDGNIWNTGVPHLVFEKNFEEDKTAVEFARKHRYPKALDDKGANVSFWFKESETYQAISFERGVEAYTHACGTGACACALDILKKENKETGLIVLNLPGGRVEIEKTESSLYLIGDAEIVYEGCWS